MQTLSSLCNAPVIGLHAPTCDDLNSTQRDEISEVNHCEKICAVRHFSVIRANCRL